MTGASGSPGERPGDNHPLKPFQEGGRRPRGWRGPAPPLGLIADRRALGHAGPIPWSWRVSTTVAPSPRSSRGQPHGDMKVKGVLRNIPSSVCAPGVAGHSIPWSYVDSRSMIGRMHQLARRCAGIQGRWTLATSRGLARREWGPSGGAQRGRAARRAAAGAGGGQPGWVCGPGETCWYRVLRRLTRRAGEGRNTRGTGDRLTRRNVSPATNSGQRAWPQRRLSGRARGR